MTLAFRLSGKLTGAPSPRDVYDTALYVSIEQTKSQGIPNGDLIFWRHGSAVLNRRERVLEGNNRPRRWPVPVCEARARAPAANGREVAPIAQRDRRIPRGEGAVFPQKEERSSKREKIGYQTRLLRYDTFALAALRRKVHGYFMRNEMPTAEKLRNDVISDTDMDMPTISTRTMQRMLNDLGFLFRKRKRNSALLERDDIVSWRRKYLRTIREMRRQQR
ncbi:hypothetical protein HPB50_026640 [Hyalomma asiaticum]|uniref:Uncharacterized protein n=2 Tax=Hyalomma asiaticum TaxID=266040 RepID=A0ACB7T048_HYAAI|nr:hypothetical protein HPB50_026640 [Hyalomma asiaticum]